MSMHKIPLTPVEEAGLKAHGLDIGTPSQLSDAFRQGVAWALSQPVQDKSTVFINTETLLRVVEGKSNIERVWVAKVRSAEDDTPLYTFNPDAEMKRLINLYEEDLTLLLQLFANEMGQTERVNLRKRLVELRMFQRKV